MAQVRAYYLWRSPLHLLWPLYALMVEVVARSLQSWELEKRTTFGKQDPALMRGFVGLARDQRLPRFSCLSAS